MNQHNLSLNEAGALVYFLADFTMFGGSNDQSIFSIVNSFLSHKANTKLISQWLPFMYYLLISETKLPAMSGVIFRGNFSQLKFVNGNRVSRTCCTLGCKDKNTLLSSFTGQSIFEITATDAKDVSLFSMIPEDDVVLFYPNIFLKVEKRSENNNIESIHLIQQPTPAHFKPIFKLLNVSKTVTASNISTNNSSSQEKINSQSVAQAVAPSNSSQSDSNTSTNQQSPANNYDSSLSNNSNYSSNNDNISNNNYNSSLSNNSNYSTSQTTSNMSNNYDSSLLNNSNYSANQTTSNMSNNYDSSLSNNSNYSSNTSSNYNISNFNNSNYSTNQVTNQTTINNYDTSLSNNSNYSANQLTDQTMTNNYDTSLNNNSNYSSQMPTPPPVNSFDPNKVYIREDGSELQFMEPSKGIIIFTEKSELFYKNFEVGRKFKGDRYEGGVNSENLKMCGYGVYENKVSGRYEGNWKDDKKHGFGKYIHSNKRGTYEGNFENDQRNGKGLFLFDSGDKYEGQFKNGLKHGYGIWSFISGMRYEGEMKDDKRSGIGTMHYLQRESYTGEFLNDKKHGNGKYLFKNGCTWEGKYLNGDSQGTGKFVYPNGNEEIVLYSSSLGNKVVENFTNQTQITFSSNSRSEFPNSENSKNQCSLSQSTPSGKILNSASRASDISNSNSQNFNPLNQCSLSQSTPSKILNNSASRGEISTNNTNNNNSNFNNNFQSNNLSFSQSDSNDNTSIHYTPKKHSSVPILVRSIFDQVDHIKAGRIAVKKEYLLIESKEESESKKNELMKKFSKIKKESNLKVIELLGKGTYGQVHSAQYKNTIIAVKSITQIDDETLSEFKIMKDLNHEICESDMQKYLENKIDGKIELDQIKAWCYQLLLGLEHLHSHQIIHRDLKPGNVLLKRVLNAQKKPIWIPKIADFGMARKFENHAMFTVSAAVGTEIYNAPELWRFTGGVAEELISYNSDIWTLGLIFLQIWYNIHFNELCNLITTSVLDKKFDCLDPDKLPILIQDIFTKYLENSANRENLVILKYMLTSVEQRKSARDIIYYFSCIE